MKSLQNILKFLAPTADEIILVVTNTYLSFTSMGVVSFKMRKSASLPFMMSLDMLQDFDWACLGANFLYREKISLLRA